MCDNNKFYICEHCGNLIGMIHDAGVPMHKELTTTEATQHIFTITLFGHTAIDFTSLIINL